MINVAGIGGDLDPEIEGADRDRDQGIVDRETTTEGKCEGGAGQGTTRGGGCAGGAAAAAGR